MKIIKEGTVKNDWEGKWNCGSCGTQWVMEPNDNEPKHVDDWRDGGYYEMTCPYCLRNVTRSTHINGQQDR